MDMQLTNIIQFCAVSKSKIGYLGRDGPAASAGGLA